MASRTPQMMTTRTNMDTNIVTAAPMDGVTPATFGFDAQSTKAVGLAKLRNKVCKLLWTKKGSNPLNLSEGTDLVDLYVYNLTDYESTYMAVNTAVTETMSQIQYDQELAGSPDTERLTSLEIVEVRIDNTGLVQTLHITLSILSAAGETATFELPSAVA